MSPPVSLRLDPDLIDPGWDALPNDGGVTGGLSFASTQIRNSWIVRLDFRQNSTPKGEQSHGTGFYINIPDTRAHVILTAAHNLVDKGGKRSQDLQFYDPFQAAIIKPGDLDIFISPSYMSSMPRPQTGADFGAIRVPSSTSNPRGFGFSLKLAEERLRDKSLQVCGFPSDSTRPEPDTSSGECKRSDPTILEYKINTAKGFSGAPVFMPFKDHDTVVGIHTNGSDPRYGNSKACRVNERALEQIFRWLGVGYEKKALRVFPSKDAPPEGLYLRFPPYERYGWVRLGEKGLETTFDIFPAYAPTSNLPQKPTYVFRFRQPRGWPQARKDERWVLWDFVRDVVTLTDKLQDCCFPRIEPKKKSKKNPTNNSEVFRIVLPSKDPDNPAGIGYLVEFCMRNNMLIPEDIAMGEMDTPEVGFVRRNKPVKFTDMCFE
ncbi:hypothetical protein MGYG_08227 [Nannizzia gypsea CBS 118893]|uniref:Serine protease n=1 Tax=Arthroderma gypseum (strain ATCC MYA-4604 / CBS 118893) TaxID=535722 RepID=E4V5D9_ARTGP|nr:hypothetical protein MGYG_08227 [Nannizzia gypsea CBS 118893]EFR05213.1 hypothetical protein MGYG_08227 [Nannizzia gypsea CBS 118893]